MGYSGRKTTVAWILSLIGGILGFIGFLIYAIAGTVMAAAMEGMPGWIGGLGVAVCYWFVIAHLTIIFWNTKD